VASRQTAGTTSAFQYAAPNTYANAAFDIALSNQTTNPGSQWVVSAGLGVSNTASSQLLPILPANATPTVNGITESGTTVTVFLGTPHGLTSGSSGQTVVVSTAVLGYNGTFTITNVTGPYSFTYTAGSSGLTSPSGGGTVSLLGGTVAAKLPFQQALQGATFNSLATGPIEVWDDGALWDTTNSRYITPQLAGADPANLSISRN